MSFKDKLSNILKVSEDEYYDEPDSEDFEDAAEEEDEEEDYEPAARYSRPSRETKTDSNKVVSINSKAKLEIVLTKPKTMEDARSVADGLNQKKAVVLNLESVNGETARRILDFLSGVTYANKATMRQVANGTFIITPHNVDVNGDLLGELSSSGYSFDR